VDRDRISAITHGDRAFHNPVDVARVTEAVDRLGLGPGDRVLDVGCGAGELLVDLAVRHGCGGFGFDTSEILIEEARRRAAARAPGADLDFAAVSAADVVPDGSFAAACCLGSMHAIGGLRTGLAWLRRAIAPGGALLIADGFWPGPRTLPSWPRSERRRTSCRRSRACSRRAARRGWSRSGSPRARRRTGSVTSGR
jgi:SAM-dependent methyltransferase